MLCFGGNLFARVIYTKSILSFNEYESAQSSYKNCFQILFIKVSGRGMIIVNKKEKCLDIDLKYQIFLPELISFLIKFAIKQHS